MKTEPSTTYKSYVRDALRTESDHMQAFARVCADPRKMRLLHAVMGLCTETGELQDAVKKHLFYGSNLDLVNLREECGDLFWYLAILADVLGEANFTNMLQANIKKLKVRYPEKFTDEAANNRDLKSERQALEDKHEFVAGHPMYGPDSCKVCAHPQDSTYHL